MKKKGYTLIEVVVVLGLLAIITAVMFSIITMATRISTKAKEREIVYTNEKVTVINLTEELRTATDIIVTTTTTANDTIEAKNINNESYIIKLGSDKKLCKMKNDGTILKVLGDNITNVTFGIDGRLCSINAVIESGTMKNNFKTTVVIL